MSLNEIRKFIFEKYYKQIGFSNECSYYSMKYLKKKKKKSSCLQIIKKKKKKIVVACKEIKIPEKILDPCNPKEHDQ